MNKFPFFLAFATFALLACSGDEPEPDHYEICAKNPFSKKCLTGSWMLVDVEGSSTGCKPADDIDDILKLKANGQFVFQGYSIYPDFETNGTWEVNDKVMTINCITGDCSENYPLDATFEVIKSGQELRITTANGRSAFLQCGPGRFIEVFSRIGNE